VSNGNNIDPAGLIGEIVPNIYLERVRLESRKSGAGSMATLDLTLHEVRGASAASSWSKNEDFLGKMRVKIIRSLDPHFSNIFIEELNLNPSADAFTGLDFTTTINVGASIAAINRMEEGHVGSGLGAKTTTTIDSSGHMSAVKTFNVPWVDYGLPEEINHLTYFLLTYLDLSDEEGFDAANVLNLTGRVEYQEIIRSGVIVNSEATYRDDAGLKWSGEVHSMPDGNYMTGRRHTAASKNVSRVVEGISKVHDLRAPQRLERIQIDFSFLENQLFPEVLGSIKQLSNESAKFTLAPIGKTNAFFTDVFMSGDANNHCRLLFGVDYANILANKTKFGKFYELVKRVEDAEIFFPDATNESFIASAKLKRRRVIDSADYNQLMSPVPGGRLIDEDKPDTILAETSDDHRTGRAAEDSHGNLISVNSSVASLTETGIITPLQDLPMRYFTAVDKTVTNSTHGTYQYGIELEIYDKSSMFIHNLVDELDDSRRVLEEYLNLAQLPGNYNFGLNRFSTRFANEQRDLWRGRYSDFRGPSWESVLFGYVATTWLLTEMSHLSAGDSERLDMETLADLIYSLIEPDSATLDGIQTVIKLVEDLMSRLAGIATPELSKTGTTQADPTEYRRDNQNQSRMWRSSGTSRKTFVVEKWFDNELFDADSTKNVGYEYLVPHSDPEILHTGRGLYKVSLSEFMQRATDETKKYFTSDNIMNMDIDSGLGTPYTLNDSLSHRQLAFFSPSKGSVGGTVVSFDTIKGTPVVYRNFEERVRYFNAFKTLHGVLPSDARDQIEGEPGQIRPPQEWREFVLDAAGADFPRRRPRNRRRDQLASLDDAFIPQPGIPREIELEPGEEEERNAADDAFGGVPQPPPPPVLEESDDPLPEIVAAADPEPADALCRRIDRYDILSDCNAIDNNTSYSTPEEMRASVKDLPNQIKSLFLGRKISNNDDVTNVNWLGLGDDGARPIEDPVLGPIFRINYEMLQKVEVLTGYELSGDSPSMKKPAFQPLTEGILTAAIHPDNPRRANLLCRLAPYSDKNYVSTRTRKELNLPIYNKHFILHIPNENLSRDLVKMQVMDAPPEIGIATPADAALISGAPPSALPRGRFLLRPPTRRPLGERLAPGPVSRGAAAELADISADQLPDARDQFGDEVVAGPDQLPGDALIPDLPNTGGRGRGY